VALRKSTKVWLAVFAAAAVVIVIDGGSANRLGGFVALAWAAAVTACLVLAFRGIRATFRLIVRRLSLRLAFSYFLIGIVPIPLLAMLLFVCSYVIAHQFVATRVWQEAVTLLEQPQSALPAVRVRDGKVLSSDVAWLQPGDPVPWVSKLDVPRPVVEVDNIWLAARTSGADGETVALLHVNEPSRRWLQLLADRTGYTVQIEKGDVESTGKGYEIDIERRGKPAKDRPQGAVRPAALPVAREPEWVGAVYVEPTVASFHPAREETDVVLFIAKTSPRVVFEQLFAQGLPGAAKILWGVTVGLAGALLLVYLIALALAFALVAAITKNVNRMSAASAAIARGDFSVRVNSKSRDQIGDLARSFDGMAESIQRLLRETARKERLEGEIAVARTIQQKLLPPVSGELAGVRVLAHFQSVAEIGGDYYDYLAAPDGRAAIAVGDVSGHGLPTGLLVAMAKAALATLIETGLTGSPLFARLNDLIHRSTDSRSYMTLALFLYDPATRSGELTNAGQLAPYRVSSSGVESLALPSFPLGVSARSEFPTREWSFASGDRVVFLTDGLVECASPAGEPFGFERLEAVLAREAGSTAESLRDAILREVETHTGGAPPDDDRTLVLVTLEQPISKGDLDENRFAHGLAPAPRTGVRDRPDVSVRGREDRTAADQRALGRPRIRNRAHHDAVAQAIRLGGVLRRRAPCDGESEGGGPRGRALDRPEG